MNKSWTLLLSGALLVELSGVTASAQVVGTSANSFAIRDVRVFDGKREFSRTNVVVIEGRVAAIGQRIAPPAGLAVIEGRGKTLLPGFIDSHVHVFPGAQADALRFGVTAELDMFNLSHEFARWSAQRESLNAVFEADTWSAGTGVTVPGGHPNQWVPEDMPRLSGADGAPAFIEARIAEGSNYIKLIVEDNAALDPANPLHTLSRPELCASVAAARAHGRLVVAHVTNQANARMAIECGVNGLAHTVVDAPMSAELVRLAKKRGVFAVSTLSLLAAESGASPGDLPASADVRLLSASQRGSLNRTTPLVHPGQLAIAQESVRRMHDAGVIVLAGTDAPAPGTAHGVSMHREMALLVQAGLTPVEALAAATSVPAKVFGLGDRGRIAEGNRADLLLVDGDPTVEIAATLRIDRIWKNGYPVDRAVP
ncbi:MAG TPA: amidohydrolase family protein [Steroidobacteraceae bacterium]|nr:amidohydrolase family protein [Steroidobacteraceae bacterium]